MEYVVVSKMEITTKNSWNDIKSLYSHKRVYMRSAENKYLKTISRVFGPAVEKAMPVILKVSFGSIGVLFVTALVLIYSDKRLGDGWEHAEAMAFMIQRATVILMWLVLVALVVTVIWLSVYMVINSRTANRRLNFSRLFNQLRNPKNRSRWLP